MNIGKVFETEFKTSVPKEYFFYRFRDGTSSFEKGENTRFQAKNICDCLVMGKRYLYLLELKNTKGASLPFHNIKENQLRGLQLEYENIKTFFIICFRDKEKCYAVEVKKINDFKENTTRKSIPLEWCMENGIEIKMIKKRIRYKLDLSTFFE